MLSSTQCLEVENNEHNEPPADDADDDDDDGGDADDGWVLVCFCIYSIVRCWERKNAHCSLGDFPASIGGTTVEQSDLSDKFMCPGSAHVVHSGAAVAAVAAVSQSYVSWCFATIIWLSGGHVSLRTSAPGLCLCVSVCCVRSGTQLMAVWRCVWLQCKRERARALVFSEMSLFHLSAHCRWAGSRLWQRRTRPFDVRDGARASVPFAPLGSLCALRDLSLHAKPNKTVQLYPIYEPATAEPETHTHKHIYTRRRSVRFHFVPLPSQSQASQPSRAYPP